MNKIQKCSNKEKEDILNNVKADVKHNGIANIEQISQ